MKNKMDEKRNRSPDNRSLRILFPIEPSRGVHLQWLGLMIMSGILKKEGFEVEMVEADIDRISKKLKDSRPTILGYSVPTYLAKFYLEFNKRVKDEFDVFSIFGGPHPTYYPEVIDTEGVDAICIGEGDYALLDLAKKLEGGEPVNSIMNLWVKEDGKVHKNPLRPLIKDLDELPFPDRDLFSTYQPRTGLSSIGTMTGRGCPYNCTYCFNKGFRRLYRKEGTALIRQRSVDNVIDELQELKGCYPATYFIFWDDVLILSREWLEEFSKKYRSKIGLPFSCNVRANLVKPGTAKLLKEAGCHMASMGIEAGNDYLRNQVLKRQITKDQTIDAIETLRKEGIRIQTFNLIGIPKGSIENDFETLALNIECKVDYAMCFILQPYPRTEIYDIAKSEGLIEQKFEGFDSLKIPYGYHPPLKKSPEERLIIENLHKLFAFMVEFPKFLPLLRTLLKFPGGRLYSLIYYLWFKYAQYIRVHPARLSRIFLYLKNRCYNFIHYPKTDR